MSLISLVCLVLQAFAIAQTNTSPPPTNPPQTSAAPATKPEHGPSAHSAKTHAATHASARTSAPKSGKKSRGKKGSRKRGQQVIDSARAREIQEALIREHYLQGQPSGKWDAATQAAMQRYQTDQGWQSKTIPDSRALIKLGLGPSTDHLLNPETAQTAPVAPGPKTAAGQNPPQDKTPQR